jgi:hypothetical protein
LEVAVAHGQHTTRRAFLVGAAGIAVAAGAAIPEVAKADPPFRYDAALAKRADTVVGQYAARGVTIWPNSSGGLAKAVHIDLDGRAPDYDEVIVAELDKRLAENPDLAQAVIKRVRELYKMST